MVNWIYDNRNCHSESQSLVHRILGNFSRSLGKALLHFPNFENYPSNFAFYWGLSITWEVKSLRPCSDFQFETRLEPLNTSFACCYICITAQSTHCSLESNLNIDENRSTSCVGGFWEIDAPSWICSEPPSLKSGEMGTKGLSFQEFNWKLMNCQAIRVFKPKYG